MAQVDHELTTVNCFDQRLGLIKNMGRHKMALNRIACFVFLRVS
jgi:hypothetical protein